MQQHEKLNNVMESGNHFKNGVMKIKRKLVMLLSIMVFIGISSCSDDNDNGSNNPSVIDAKVVDGSEYNDQIVTVKALIVESYERYPGGGYYQTGYEVASCPYKNGGFKLNLSKDVPSQYLESLDETDFGEEEIAPFVSDKNAKIANLSILAYDEADKEIGEFYLNWENEEDAGAIYCYADRDFTVKGTYNYGDYKDIYNVSIRKGWNIIYNKETNESFTSTTSKPNGANFKWYFEEN